MAILEIFAFSRNKQQPVQGSVLRIFILTFAVSIRIPVCTKSCIVYSQRNVSSQRGYYAFVKFVFTNCFCDL